jgi:hypothetical protein
MPQDQEARRHYESEARAARAERLEERDEEYFDEMRLRSDQHNGQYAVLPPNTEALDARECKDAQSLLPEMTKEEWKRVHLVPPGTRLRTGDKYVDLRDVRRGELIATGEETANQSSLLVAKNDVDYEIWNRLLGRDYCDFIG